MAIAAIELHGHSVRPHEILFQMHSVIEFNGSGIDASGTHRRKFGMAGVESVDISRVTYCGAGGAKIGVALRAAGVAGRSQPQAAAMLTMTRCAVRGKQLVGVVNGAVVASLASLVVGFRTKSSGLLYVARATLLGEYGMTHGHLPAAVHVIVAGQPVPGQPDNRERRYTDR